jgi:hypothetical protein
MILSASSLHSQDAAALVEQIYQANEVYEKTIARLYPYSYRQDILFQKLDDDSAVEEQSRRIYQVRAVSEGEWTRDLLNAMDYKDGIWQDVTAEDKENQNEGESKKFSLREMVGPAYRDAYIFSIAGVEDYNRVPVYHIKVGVKEPDEDRFNGDLWVHREDYIVVKAILHPSDLPAAVDSMTMEFDMSKQSGHWLPEHVKLYAEVSFLFFFSGRIRSVITFSDYKFFTRP